MREISKKVLFLRFSSLGDVILSNFYLMKIKQTHPDWHLTWLVDSMYGDMVRSQPWVDDVIVWDRQNEGNMGFVRTIERVRSGRFDVLVDMHNTDRSSFFSLFSNIPIRYTDRYRLPLAHNKHSFEGLFDITTDIAQAKKYLFSPPITERVRKLLPSSEGAPMVVLAIGASYLKKRWPIKNWTQFCRMATGSGHCLLLTGNGQDEEKDADTIIRGVGHPLLINLVGKLSLNELIQVVDSGDITISCDTGTLHMARALGKDTIAMFGPSTLKDTSYFESLKNVFYCNCPDRGCHDFKCEKPCMETISPVAIHDRLLELTGARSLP